MKHVRAQEVFPESLLKEMQKYVQGELVYIPKSPANRKNQRIRLKKLFMLSGRCPLPLCSSVLPHLF